MYILSRIGIMRPGKCFVFPRRILCSQKKYWQFGENIVLPDKVLNILKVLWIQKRFCVSINYNFVCPGKVLCVQDRYSVLRKVIVCPGKVLCAQERYCVFRKGILCPGKVLCVQRIDILCSGKVLCVQDRYSVLRKGIVCPG